MAQRRHRQDTHSRALPGILPGPVPIHQGELWTARQRQMHPMHYTVSYRASFKPELPDFFIQRYLPKGKGIVLDPFGGRGTTIVQANLLGLSGIYNDLNPASVFLARARQFVPPLEEVLARLNDLDLKRRRPEASASEKERFLPFFHPSTFGEILNLREALLADIDDPCMRTIGLAALSRLHGHSDGFFSVYSFPQISILPSAQRRNNLARGQKPEYRDVKVRIRKKLERDFALPIPKEFAPAAARNVYLNGDARALKGVRSASVDLIVTSPPFLDKVDYQTDNWMRAWFLNLEEKAESAPLMVTPDVGKWRDFMRDVIREMGRVLKPGGKAVIEVGEVKKGRAMHNLEEEMISSLPISVGSRRIEVRELFLNMQSFTKLSNCWDVSNNLKGTNSNRCLVLEKA